MEKLITSLKALLEKVGSCVVYESALTIEKVNFLELIFQRIS